MLASGHYHLCVYQKNVPRERAGPGPKPKQLFCLAEPYQDLRIAIDSLIEFIVSIRGVFNRYVMADDAPWLGAARYDQIPQIFVVSLDRSLPTADGKRFVKEIGHRAPSNFSSPGLWLS